VLIFTASVGEGHDLPARVLAAAITSEESGAEVAIIDGLAAMGGLITRISEDAPRVVFFRFRWVWDVAFFVFAGFAPTRSLTRFLLAGVGSRGLLRSIEEARPDVIVSTYPHTTEVLGRLRRRGRLTIPACTAITDLAAMHYWASRGVDLHLITHPESAAEVREVAGAGTRVVCVRGLTDPRFLAPPQPHEARAALDLPTDGQIVLVSGGGWGVGDLERGTLTALELESVAAVVCLCGRNDELRSALARRFSAEPRVRVEGFTNRMPEWLSAADILVHSTGGLTVLEALMCGCRVISFGWGRGHVRLNNRAFERFGLAAVARNDDELRSALRAGLAHPIEPDRSFAELPSAASLVLSLAHVLPGAT
jgi:processive 1,2-diacylglycerol beta-glucosyltransferase